MRTVFQIITQNTGDGHWIAEILQLPGARGSGRSLEDAVRKAQAAALRLLAKRLEQGEFVPEIDPLFSIAA
jgi:predicted RNase H-like HicB family nuclease